MRPFEQFPNNTDDNPALITENIGPTAIRAGGLAILAKLARLNGEIQADKSATTAERKLSWECVTLAGLVSAALYSVTADQKR